MKKSFSFVLNHIDIQVSLPMELIPNHVLQRADDEQISTIKEKLRLFGSSDFHDGYYECEFVRDTTEHEGTPTDMVKMVKLPRADWRYWVVAFDGPNSEMGDLEVAFALLLNDLRFGFTVTNIQGKEGFSWNPEMMLEYSNFWRFLQHPSPKIGAELQQVRQFYFALQKMKESFPSIYRAARQLHLLKRLPPSSEFKVIGFFSVIEAVITHAPELTEPMDSLTHQMKTKINLLSKRFQRKLNYDGFFERADEDKVWGKLYGYRSKLAHGDLADFEKEFKILRSSEHVLQFLNEAAKLLIICAMHEPQLVSDLKKC